MFWNKTLLKWEEPRFAQKYIAKHLQFKDYLTAFGKTALKLVLGTYIVFWFIRWISPRGSTSFLDFEILSVVLLIVSGYFLIWLLMLVGTRLSKPYISLREKDVLVIAVEGQLSIPYKKMESFGVIKTNLEENEYYILTIRDWNGNESFIEIDPKIDKELVAKVLKSKNIQMKTPLLCPSSD
jgi:hypothetical protein